MPTYYVEDYDGKKASDAVEREQIPLPDEKATQSEANPKQAKVVDEDKSSRSTPAKKTSAAKTKG